MRICGVCGGKGLLWIAKRKGLGKKKGFLFAEKSCFRVQLEKFSAIGNVFAEKAAFSIHEKPTNKEKLFLSTAKLQFRTAPKLTCNNPFRIPLATVSLQQNNPFSKLRSLASDV